MTNVLSALTLVPILSLIALLGLATSRANAWSGFIRQYVTVVLAIQACLACVCTITVVWAGGGVFTPDLIRNSTIDAGFGSYIDGVSGLMLTMVSIIGFVVSRFSIRYLDGEAMQGRYFRWLGCTAGAVSMMVVSGNLLQFFAAWVVTSLGLHQLLLHYRYRAAAHRAAWTKFVISRLGDIFLVSALALIFQQFGTFEIAALLQAAGRLTGEEIEVAHHAVGWLIVLGALTKSAQFPFHSWLPNTMETPTPVSALMHAGVVNAGGYLIIRTSPLVSLAPEALGTLAAVGAFTASFAGIVMMTQSSIKRTLAYSTIAQMGFMMLQCGLGAFSAAMLHILSHSFYKAHAFLTSGSVISQSLATQGATTPDKRTSGYALVPAMLLPIASFAAASSALGLDFQEKSGGIVLMFSMSVALTTWGWRLFTLPERSSVAMAVLGIFGLSVVYLGSYFIIDSIVAGSVAKLGMSAMSWVAIATAGIGFSALLILQFQATRQASPAWLERWRIHASNGFYVDALYQRWFGGFAKP